MQQGENRLRLKVKKRDQGYQAIDKGCTKLRLDDLREIFHQEKTQKVSVPESESDTLTLKCAFNIAKCVPRQTNRCKWREKSGFAPNILQPSSNSGKLFSGDLVFIRYLNNQLIYLIVTEDTTLDDVNMSLKVRRPQGNSSVGVASVKLEQLIKDGENVVAVPCNMYQIEGDGSIELDESISYMFDALMNKDIVSRTDIEWNELLSVPASVIDEGSPENTESDDEEIALRTRKKKRRNTLPF